MSQKLLASLLLTALFFTFTPEPSSAGPQGTSGFSPVNVASSLSVQQTLDNLRKLVAKNGMMVMGEVNQGKIMSMAGVNMKATSVFIGSPMVGKKIFGENIGATVAAPFRVTVFENRSGGTVISYYKPSELLSSFRGGQTAMIAADLDRKLDMLTRMAGK